MKMWSSKLYLLNCLKQTMTSRKRSGTEYSRLFLLNIIAQSTHQDLWWQRLGNGSKTIQWIKIECCEINMAWSLHVPNKAKDIKGISKDQDQKSKPAILYLHDNPSNEDKSQCFGTVSSICIYCRLLEIKSVLRIRIRLSRTRATRTVSGDRLSKHNTKNIRTIQNNQEQREGQGTTPW